MAPDRTLTVCPVCRLVTEYYLNSEASCVHCLSSFKIPEDSDINGSLSKIVPSEESNHSEEVQVNSKGVDFVMNDSSDEVNHNKSPLVEMASAVKKRKKSKRLESAVRRRRKRPVGDQAAQDIIGNLRFQKLYQPATLRETCKSGEEKATVGCGGSPAVESTMNEFKLLLVEEIKKQVFSSLVKPVGDIQVVRIEGINPCTSSILPTEVNQNYSARIKLMTTLSVPITLQKNEGEPENRDKDESMSGKDADSCVMKNQEQQQRKQVKNDDELAGHLHSEEVPETRFYDFGCLRNERAFVNGQIWVFYNHIDGMPRDFLRINKVVNIDPFRVQVTLLKPVAESSSIGSSSTCGYYKSDGKLRMISDVDCFSHMPMCVKGPSGTIRVHPLKDQVWALYKRNEACTSGGVEYDIVEVSRVTNHDIFLIPLVKYRRYRTVFLEQSSMEFQLSLSKELSRFSHEIPAYKLIGTIGSARCFELDPAAIPPQLIDDSGDIL